MTIFLSEFGREEARAESIAPVATPTIVGFSIIRVTGEGQSNGGTNLSFGAADGSGELRLFDEHGTAYNVTSTIGATVAVKSGKRSQPHSTEVEPSQNHFQIDLVEGEVIPN